MRVALLGLEVASSQLMSVSGCRAVELRLGVARLMEPVLLEDAAADGQPPLFTR